MSTTNLFSDAFANAKPLKRKQTVASTNGDAKKAGQAKPTGQPADQPKDQPKQPSLRDRLRQTTSTVLSAQELKVTLADADDCQKDTEVIRGYVELVNQTDTLGLYMLGQNLAPEKAQDAWFGMDWDEQEQKLREWSENGNEIARDILSNLQPFNDNALLREFLRQVVVEFSMPLRWINTWAGLRRFLDELVQREWAKPVNRPTRIPDNGVVIPGREGDTLYLPNRGVRAAEGGWMFVKEAAERVKSFEDKINSLREEATPGLTPEKISKRQPGFLFLRTGGTQAVLLEAFEQGGWMTVAIAKSVGYQDGQLPVDPVLWDDKSHRPQASNRWGWIIKAMDGMVAYQRQVAESSRRDHFERLEPITRLANMPIRFEDGGLIRLIQGENGVVAIWNNKFRWGTSGKTGLLGVALERSGERFSVLEVITDFHFPKAKLVGENLPVVFDMDKPSVKMRHQPREDKDVSNGLEMLCRLLYLRLQAEQRAKQPNSTTPPQAE